MATAGETSSRACFVLRVTTVVVERNPNPPSDAIVCHQGDGITQRRERKAEGRGANERISAYLASQTEQWKLRITGEEREYFWKMCPHAFPHP